MSTILHAVLYQLLDICGIEKKECQLLLQASSLDEQINIYHQYIPKIEAHIWQHKNPEDILPLYYQLFQNLEAIIAEKGNDNRHSFIIVMPLADRPKHLRRSLDSLLSLCENFQYGGKHQYYKKINVLIADDSVQSKNISEHKKIVESFNRQGLSIEYFGLDEQNQQLDKLDADLRQKLKPVIGDISQHSNGHKGASIMRNISYLRVNELQQQQPNSLIYFIDSDQSFSVNQQTSAGDKSLQSINYFYYLDRLFEQQNIQVLTGKVVGDPPVSPAVMAANFMDDVMAFLQQIKTKSAQSDCCFHGQINTAEDGAYHDMADMFGFSSSKEFFDYHCEIVEAHNHIQSLNMFAKKLNHFFDGEHPTRKNYYQYTNVLRKVEAARTVYTGNYVLTADALKYFIPFASLKLRMAGPSLGRVLKAELGDKFVSANLPMLHKRTIASTGTAEFRSGIKHQDNCVDLSGEFERQFYGDVMLFSIESLYQSSDLVDIHKIKKLVISIHKNILNQYHSKQQQLIKKMHHLQELINDPLAWWNTEKESKSAQENMQSFMDNMLHNFSENSRIYQRINDDEYTEKQFNKIIKAIMDYQDNRRNWQAALQ